MSKYSKEVVNSFCTRLAEGQSMREICRDDEMPDKSTILRWLGKHDDFRTQYAHAKEAGIEVLAEEIIDIADDGANDWMERNVEEGKDAGYLLNGEHVQRSRLRVDARKWVLSKLKPKKYGDKLQIESETTIKGEISDIPLTEEEFEKEHCLAPAVRTTEVTH